MGELPFQILPSLNRKSLSPLSATRGLNLRLVRVPVRAPLERRCATSLRRAFLWRGPGPGQQAESGLVQASSLNLKLDGGFRGSLAVVSRFGLWIGTE